MKHRRTRALPLLTFICLLASAVATACGGPGLATLAPGVYGDAGEGGSAGQAGTTSDQAGAVAITDAGAAGLEASAGEGGSGG